MGTPLVLIVDDDAMARENLIAYLEDDGMQARGVASGEAALGLLHQGQTFDVCIMDMRLPGMDGNDSIRTLHAAAPALAFIIHTGSAGYSLPDDLKAMGIERHQVFHKPLKGLAPLAKAVLDLAGHGGAETVPAWRSP